MFIEWIEEKHVLSILGRSESGFHRLLLLDGLCHHVWTMLERHVRVFRESLIGRFMGVRLLVGCVVIRLEM